MLRYRSVAILAAVLISCATAAQASVTLERDFSYDAQRVKLTQKEGYSYVAAKTAMRELAAGRPDLPWLSERVELPQGMEVTSVEVVDVQAEALASGAHLPSAEVPHPGLGPIERSKPDPAYFNSVGFQPAQIVALGAQGDMRGHRYAYLRVAGARWEPTTGTLERISHVKVRITLEPSRTQAVTRERIVREWEDEGLPSGIPTKELGAALASATPLGKGKTAPFRATQVPSVLGSPVAYVIVTNDAMAPAFQQLADWKTQSGVPAVVRTTSFIRQQYPAAADDAERIRLFLRDCYSRWGTKWALLGGDTDVIPARQAFTTFYGGESIATDLYYQCLDGNWNADGDSLYGEGYYDNTDPGDNVDLLPELYVGRAPVLTLSDAQTFVNKTLQYEKTPLGTYEDKWLMFSEVLFPQGWQPGQDTSLDGAELTEDLLPVTDQMPNVHVGRLYENYTDVRWRPGSLPEHKAGILDSLSSGYGLAIHVGHGYRNIMEVGDGSMTNADALGLTNGNKLFNLYAIDCTSNAIDFPCIGEAFILNPNGGAVTNIGSTRFDFPAAGRAYQVEYFRKFVEDSVTAVGELEARQKLPFIAYSSYDGVNRWTQMTLLMLGDPELRMWRGKPRLLSVSAPASVAVSDSQFTVTVTSNSLPVANARVTAYKAGDDFRSVMTNAAGVALVPFRPDSIGSFTLTVTAFNAHPAQQQVTITATAAPLLVETTPVILDNNTGGRVGDSNGQLDAGETVDLIVPVRNNGGATASSVTANLSTTSASVVIATATAAYAAVAPGATVQPTVAFRVSLPAGLADQSEIPFKFDVFDGAGHVYHETFQVTVHAPELRTFSHIESEAGGNNNGRPDVNEVVTYALQLRNQGTGIAHGVTLKLRSPDSLSVITDSTSTFGDIAPGATATGDGVIFKPLSTSAKLQLVVSDNFGVRWTQTLDITSPSFPLWLLGTGAATSIALTWAHNTEPDLMGYWIYRSTAPAGPFLKVNPVPTDRVSYYNDENLTPLTKYYYEVSAVDSSGNESLLSSPANASTNAPNHSIFPIPMGRNTPSSVALEYIYSAQQMDIVAGSDVLYLLHADGSAPVDADGSGATQGDFTTRGSYYAAGPSVANLDGTGWSIIAPAWDSSGVYVFDKAGQVRPGFPVVGPAGGIWSSVACGDVDGDGKLEMFWGSNDRQFYGVRSNGTEIIDGDANPSTKGVFKLLGQQYNYGTPAVADIDGDGKCEILMGGFDGTLYAWKGNGANVPGFPIFLGGNITSSVAVAYLDGPGDTVPEIICTSSNDSMYVFEPNGSRRPGFPIWLRMDGVSKTPSVAIADMNGDGFNDIVQCCTNGGIYVVNRDGTLVFPWANIRYSTLTSGASESSPVVADINGDGRPDIIIGDENATLTAISGLTATVLPGFPIQLAGEVRGSAAVADIDRDGKTEIVLADWDKNLYVWDYDFPFQPTGTAAWPQFHHDARRTGFASAPNFVGVDETDPGNQPVTALEFAAPSPNPSRTTSRMWFGIPAGLAGQSYEFSIYDLNGRRVKRVDTGSARAGRFSLKWDLRDESGRNVEGGVYFARFTVGGKSLSRKMVVLQ